MRPTPGVLREYALLADGYRGAILGPGGEIVWLCFPVWHDPAVFASLIGSEGFFTVGPSEPFTWGGHYEQGTLIWQSRWVTTSGIIQSRDAFVFPGRRDRAVLLRRVTATGGDAAVAVHLHPSTDYGRSTDGHWSGQHGYRRWTTSEGLQIELHGLREGTVRDGTLDAVMHIPEGEHRDLILTVGDGSADGGSLDPEELWSATAERWTAGDIECPDAAASRDVRQAYAVIRGLTAPTGGTVAAATCSLPEQDDKGRGYDYRYVWIRDLCYTAGALAASGATQYVAGAAGYVADRVREDGDNLMPAYTIDGERIPSTHHLHVPGYPGGTDLIGNQARGQFQLDAFGEVLLLFAKADELGVFARDGWAAVQTTAAAIERRWTEPDAGIWELEPRQWTHSRLICAAGLRAIAARPTAGEGRGAWLALADRIVADVSRDSTHPSGRWQRATDDERVDASLLVPGLRGATPTSDPRHIATYQAVREELCAEGYVYRFRHDADEGLGTAEGAFLLCSFWMCMAAIDQGDVVEAARWFERGRAGCGSPGLFSEELDVADRQLKGNLPQAFVHGLLVESAFALADVAGGDGK
jgi:GH15 family glucan-1,4-alpha-glucosidase